MFGFTSLLSLRRYEENILGKTRFGDSRKGIVIIIEEFVASKIKNRHEYSILWEI